MASNSSSERKPYRGKLGQDFTTNVIDSMGPATSPRMREVMGVFIQHIHDFARETNLTVDEWTAAVQMINWAGQMSNNKRNEGQLMCDIIGLESWVSLLLQAQDVMELLTWSGWSTTLHIRMLWRAAMLPPLQLSWVLSGARLRFDLMVARSHRIHLLMPLRSLCMAR
jgi:hypothetical protein